MQYGRVKHIFRDFDLGDTVIGVVWVKSIPRRYEHAVIIDALPSCDWYRLRFPNGYECPNWGSEINPPGK